MVKLMGLKEATSVNPGDSGKDRMAKCLFGKIAETASLH